MIASRIRRLKARLLAADYEICLARAGHFTDVYRETEGLDPALRNALALKRTLERQAIAIEPDEHVAGSKTERYLSTPLPVERGDFLRVLQLELDVLDRKLRPFHMSAADKRRFRRDILPYWEGRTVHDRKAARWAERGLVQTRPGLVQRLRGSRDTIRFARYVGRESLGRILGATARGPWSLRRLRDTVALRHELTHTHPTPAVYCMDVQGHLILGLGRVVERGMAALVQEARARLSRLRTEAPHDARGAAFLEAVVLSLEAAIAYSERFADLAEELARAATDDDDRARLLGIAAHCRHVPRHPARTFHEAVQSMWMAHVVAEIQFGSMDVFGVGRIDQYLEPLYTRDVAAGAVTPAEARALLQELYLKLSANITPTPEVGMESNAVLGNSQHCVTLGGLTPDGRDATNALSTLALDAYEELRGTVNQLCVRLHPGTPAAFTRRACEVFRVNNGLAFYNDTAVVEGLVADGYALEHARDYGIVGCVETCGHGDTQGCVAGHDLVLPAVLMLALTDGASPPPMLGQGAGYRSGSTASLTSFAALMAAFERQLEHQLDVLVRAVAAKDEVHREHLPAPYVSALVEGCVERARDLTDGGARYDFTSVDVRGLATLVDSLLAVEHTVYERQELALEALVATLLSNFERAEPLRQRLIHEPPRYADGSARAADLTERIVAFVHETLAPRRNVRGGRYRVAWFSLGNHVIDGLFLGATPDGRRRGAPISNGVSPGDLREPQGGPLQILRAVAGLPAPQVSSGLALNLRFHPGFIRHEQGLKSFQAMLETYFALGGMQLQPTFVAVETLRDAQRHPERYRDLVVKVSGYSACFTDLGRSIQEDIIARAEL